MPAWRRTLQTIFLSQILTLVGFSCVFPFFPLFIGTLGVSGSAVVLWSGVITFAGSFTLAIASPIWGTLADRYGRKPMLVRAMGGGALVTALLIVAPNIWVVLALRILQGTLTGTVAPARALVAATVPRDELAYGMGLMEASVFAGSAIGPLVGGFLNDRLGFHGTFAIGALLLLCAALLIIFRIEEHFTPPEQSATRPRPGFLTGLRDMATLPGLALLALTIFGANFATAVASPVLPLLVPELSGVFTLQGVAQTATTVGVILAVAGLCATIAAARTRWFTDRFGYRRALIGALGGAALLSAPVAFVGNVWLLLLLRAGAGLCIGIALPSISALVSLNTPEARRGAIFGVLASAELGGFAVGPLVGGAIGAAVGLRAVFVITAIALLGIAILVAARVRGTVPAGPQTRAAGSPPPAD
jgi:DHA1 family multidrug resistance protein-like MFS transporter